MLALAALASAAACSDAATRVAYDIEAGTKHLGREEGARAQIAHTPRAWPEGCAGSYTLQIAKGFAVGDGHGNFHIGDESGGITVRCYGRDGRSHGWGTTYHLRFVDVPATVSISKDAGAVTVIDVVRRGGRAVLAALH